VPPVKVGVKLVQQYSAHDPINALLALVHLHCTLCSTEYSFSASLNTEIHPLQTQNTGVVQLE
jgi:hypothetical protein